METSVHNEPTKNPTETSTMAIEKSTHTVEVVQITEMLKHENADSLSKAKLNTGDEYSRVVRTTDWKVGDIAAWVPPDSIVDTKRPEFAFLANKAKSDGTVRIRAQKLRGVVSYGLLVPAPVDSKLGDDVASILGVEHYDPEEQSIMNEIVGKKLKITSGEVAKAPSGKFPKYDVDAYLKYGKKVFKDGEIVTVTEKIHGCFTEDTLVLMENIQYKQIKDLVEGDVVLSYDLETHVFVPDEILEVIRTPNDNSNWMELIFDNGRTVKCTENHKFLSKNRGWVEARDLTQNDDITSFEL